MGTTRKYQGKESSLLLAKKESTGYNPKAGCTPEQGRQGAVTRYSHRHSCRKSHHHKQMWAHHAVWGHTLHAQRIGRFECLQGTEFNVLMNKVYSGYPIGGICSGTCVILWRYLLKEKENLETCWWSLRQQNLLLRTWVTGDATLSPIASVAYELSLLPVWKKKLVTPERRFGHPRFWWMTNPRPWGDAQPWLEKSSIHQVSTQEFKRLKTWDWYLDREFVLT